MKRTLSHLTTLALALAAATAGVAARSYASSSSAPRDIPAFAGTVVDSIAGQQTAVFAGGCFWGIEAVFEHINGVISATSGYAGGSMKQPSYEDVSSGATGHAESVRVVFDPSKVTYAQLLHVFFSVAHDPTELNRQGPDRGTQYRSAIFYVNDSQKRQAQAYIAQLTAAKTFSSPIVTQVAPLGEFAVAEDYHQDYMAHHPNQPYIVINDAPKVRHLKAQFPALYRER